ncbi:MAG TPA: bifunctional oligoribonuclease/PAP phosphatase NrnA [Geothermobacteraceae bacterium]|nr:bifunctional oligoribonuclease/PAP phosphatase NrnA [Geothermobacteraceae bacterium]
MIRKTAELINGRSRFVVAAHESPDGDALASTLALANALREMGKDVVAYNVDGVPDSFQFLPGSATVRSQLADNERFEIGVILDAGELRRAGSHLRDRCDALINIDHHPYSEQLGPVDLLDTEAAATGVLIYRLLAELGHPVSSAVALCIYTAILADTGSFRYSNANPEAFRIAAELIALGVDPWGIASELYESQDEVRLRLLAQSLQTLTVSECGRLAAVTVTREMLALAGATSEHTDGFVNYPRSVRGVEVALFFRQLEGDCYKVGFRSKGAVDVGSLARELGGGGHHNAAGAEVSGPIDEVRRSVFKSLEALLR